MPTRAISRDRRRTGRRLPATVHVASRSCPPGSDGWSAGHGARGRGGARCRHERSREIGAGLVAGYRRRYMWLPDLVRLALTAGRPDTARAAVEASDADTSEPARSAQDWSPATGDGTCGFPILSAWL